MERAVQNISENGNSGILLKWIDRLSNPDVEPSVHPVQPNTPSVVEPSVHPVQPNAPVVEPNAPVVEEPVTSISITITLNDATKFPKTMTVEKEKTVHSVLEEYLKVRLRLATHA